MDPQDTKCTSEAEQESIFTRAFFDERVGYGLFNGFRPSFEGDD